MRLAMIVEYEGTDYRGFQYQPRDPSIQGELETAVARLTGERVRVRGAGRTDAGVHAVGQVVAFDTQSRHSTGTFAEALNFYLPDAIAVKAVYGVRDGFDPRREALARTYRYTILTSGTRSPLRRRTTYAFRGPLDTEAMREAAVALVGAHDFARFAGALADPTASTVRRIYAASVEQDDETIAFDVEGNAFLPHQVRCMAGCLVDVGRGRRTVQHVKALLEGRASGAPPRALPPQGLCLMRARYADFPPREDQANGN